MTEAQKLAMNKCQRGIVGDTNFDGELIVYSHASNTDTTVKEFIITKTGEVIHSQTYPVTKELIKELRRYAQ
jgi:hypothetical protein